MDDASDTPLVAIGDNCIDLYVQTGEGLVGGNALNVAAQWALAGHRSAYVGAVGNDDHAAVVAVALASAGVDIAGLRTLPGRTGVTQVELRADGDRVIVDEDLGVSAELQLSDTDIDALRGARWAHCATLDDFRAVARRLRDRGVPVSMDFSTEFQVDALDDLEVAFFSCRDDEMDTARGLVARAVSGGARIAIATCGAGGSVGEWSCGSAGTAFVPAFDVEVVDTLGAGDSYAAAFVVARLAGLGVPEAMEAAAQAAAVTCGHRGGWPQRSPVIAEPRP